MNSLAYFALVFAVSFLFLPGPWDLRIAIAAAGCGFLSALIRYWAFIEKITSTFLAKVVIAVVAAAALIVSPWFANVLVSEITLLRPSAFPAAYSAIQAIVILLLWATLAYIAVFLSTAFHFLRSLQGSGHTGKKTDIIAWLGRLAGLLVLLFYVAPLFIKATNYDSRKVISQLVVATSFVPNISQSVSYSSLAPDLPSDCRRLAAEQKLDPRRIYICNARTIRCSNLDENARITYLTDSDIVVAKDVDQNTPLYELNPVRFDVTKCETANRYDYGVSQKPPP